MKHFKFEELNPIFIQSTPKTPSHVTMQEVKKNFTLE